MTKKFPKDGRLNAIPPQLANSVGFLGLEADTMNWRGTFYAVNVHDKVHYLITAAHNVHRARAEGKPLRLRFREVDGTSPTIVVRNDAWTIANHYLTDVAVLSPSTLAWENGTGTSTWAIPVSMFATKDRIKSFGIVPGDGVLISGLYYRAPGNLQNEPIMRSGILAGLPNKLVYAPLLGGNLDARLVELHSIGGHSGSPVFWRAGLVGMGYGDQPSYLLLGTLHGHFDFNPDSIKDIEELKRVNEGIGIVESADSIIRSLNHDDLRKERVEWFGADSEMILPDRLASRPDQTVTKK